MRVARPLNSDELGEKGERRFSELCADAKLVANKFGRDRTGKDFLVEFPASDFEAQTSADLRPPHLSCFVQVKTMWDNNDVFSAPVKSLEYLAKDSSPSFLLVLKVTGRLEIASAHLLHIIGELQAKVLKRLRFEASKGNNLKHKKISFRPSLEGQSIPVSGEGLRSAILAATGSSIDQYRRSKTELRDKLGFEDQKHTMLIPKDIFSGEFDFVDMFLDGKQIDTNGVRFFDSRFGIEIESNYFAKQFKAGAVLQGGPAKVCDAKSLAYPKLGGEPAVFDAEVFSVNFSETNPQAIAWKIASDPITLKWKAYENRGLLVEYRHTLEDETRPASYWRNFHEFGANLLEGGRLEVRKDMKNFFDLSVPLDDPDQLERHRWMAAQASKVDFLDRLSGGEIGNVSESELVESYEPIKWPLTVAQWKSGNEAIGITTELAQTIKHLGIPTTYLLFLPFKVFGKQYVLQSQAFATRIPEGRYLKWKFDRISHVNLTKIEDTLAAYDAFISDVCHSFDNMPYFKGHFYVLPAPLDPTPKPA